MAATAEERIAKRRINELEQKLKRVQRKLKEIKVEKKQIGHLRKQAERALIVESEFKEILDDELKEQSTKVKQQLQQDDSKTEYRCRNEECIAAGGAYKNTGNCDVIETGLRLIIICRDCGSRYTLPTKASLST